MKHAAWYGTVLLAALTLGCGGDGDGGNNPPPPNTVNVQNNTFNPASLTIATGTQVTFNWVAGSVNHNVAPASTNPSATPATAGLPATFNAPFSFMATFGTQGVYRFYCTVHGSQPTPGTVAGMSGTITVQ